MEGNRSSAQTAYLHNPPLEPNLPGYTILLTKMPIYTMLHYHPLHPTSKLILYPICHLTLDPM